VLVPDFEFSFIKEIFSVLKNVF